jgi:transposase
VPIDPKSLPQDASALRRIVLDLIAQLDRESAERHKIENLLRELLDAQRNRKSEQLSKEQLALFEATWQAKNLEDEPESSDSDDEDSGTAGGSSAGENHQDHGQSKKRTGRQPLARHLIRERIVHDLTEAEKHCTGCGKDLRKIDEDISERYDFIPATLRVIEDVCLKYACSCTVRTAGKPAQPIEKSTAGASLLAQVIVAKFADHQPLHRQEKMWERHGVNISRKTMGGWMAQCAELLAPLYQRLKTDLLESKVIGTDDTGVKVLDPRLPFARTGRIWPYLGDAHHPVIVYDYTPTRGRAGPAKFLENFKGYLQADAYVVYDAFFKPMRGITEVGCWMHSRRHFFKALESDQESMGPALHLIARLYRIEDQARDRSTGERFNMRQQLSKPVLEKLKRYLIELKREVLPKSPAGGAVRYALNHWKALTCFLEDGELEIDNGATERAIRDIAIGRGNWTFFGSDNGGKTAAVLRSFIATCKRNEVEPFAWLRDVLSRIPDHAITRLHELLPHNWKSLAPAAMA